MRAVILTNVRDQKGLYRDACVLAERLQSRSISTTILDFRDGDRGLRFDLGIACEIVPSELQFSWAQEWWWKPNPEWTLPSSLERLLPRFGRVLLKTEWASELADWGPRAVVSGFESLDVGGGGASFEIPVRALHLCGGSVSRGSVAVVKAWKTLCARGLDLGAKLIVVHPAPTMSELTEHLASLPNGVVLGRLDVEDVRVEQRRAAVHVLASEHEGYGHSFWEGMSCGATVVATDGPWWRAARGAYRAVAATANGSRMLSPRYWVDHESLVEQLGLAVAEGAVYRSDARAVYDTERARFRSVLEDLLLRTQEGR